MKDETAIARMNVHDAEYKPMPEYSGCQAVLYRSPDGSRIAGSFKEAGKHTLTMGYDKFIFVISGSARLTVRNGERYVLVADDACYLRQGDVVDFEMSSDFHNVAVLIFDDTIRH